MISVPADVKLRLITAIALAPIVLFLVFYGGVGYQIMVLMLAVLMSFEWNNIISTPTRVSLDRQERTRWETIGLLYITLPSVALLALREMEQGLLIMLWLVTVVWATDIAAYFTGRTVGGPKLAPAISPNKTWSGLAGGVVASAIGGGVISLFMTNPHPSAFMFLSAALAVVAQAGDLFESWVKRYFGVKDSGTLIPGHGGVLDRIDGMLTVAPVMFLVALLWGKELF
ncbi:MAG: hypothetical protein K0R63_1219 [Rickettsiales bacterium]|jgi:phosphatidate cytidylyltransferase|nr:hypothetical protein [Rickettsiales bacterium]